MAEAAVDGRGGGLLGSYGRPVLPQIEATCEKPLI
jgi:hypothetical protein